MADRGTGSVGCTRRGLLVGGAAAAGLATVGTAGAQETVSFDGWFGGEAKGGAVDNYDGTVADERGSDTVTVEVGAEGNGGPFAFAPPALRVDPGTTVRFDWVSDTHNLIIETQPAGAGWTGHQPIENTGFTDEHTFETTGLYTYYCDPHLPLGMKAAIIVGDAEVAAPVEEAEPGWTWPGGEVGAAFLGLLLGTAGLAVLVMAAGDGVGAARRWYDRARTAAAEPLAEADPDAGLVRELDHEAFDPVGTATLIVVYFLILVVLWVFVYFVEFLGRGPTVVG